MMPARTPRCRECCQLTGSWHRPEPAVRTPDGGRPSGQAHTAKYARPNTGRQTIMNAAPIGRTARAHAHGEGYVCDNPSAVEQARRAEPYDCREVAQPHLG